MKRVRRFLTVPAVAGILFSATSACAPAPPPNVLVILVDTLRADRLGVYGNHRGLTPFLDALASRGTVFANAYAPSSWTCPSVASLFTSRYASQHGVTSFEAKLADEEVTLAEILARRGYLAGGFSANLRMLETQGYAQGFGHWQAYMGSQAGGAKPRGDLLRRESLGWLRPVLEAGTKPPVLLYLQYMEPHSPYQPIEPYRSSFRRGSEAVDEELAESKILSKKLSPAEIELLESLYDGEVAAVDAEIRALFAELEPLGFLQQSVIVVTADHGEEFGEHGTMGHGFTLYNGVARIPLMVIAPGYAGGRVVDENVSLVDVAPTVLELVGAPRAPTFEGRSLVPQMRSAVSPLALWSRLVAVSPDVISEIEPIGKGLDARRHAQAIVRGSQKLLVTRAGKTVLFDLNEDPGETKPLNGQGAIPANLLLQRLTERRAALQTRAAVRPQAQPVDDATKEKLRALGYQP